ncbi:DUF3265 domain-containing protein [Vibrio vulnificus]|nr:DUF3265 domain-containing protein [Vibrio vulnificus]
MTRRLRGIHAAWHFCYAVSFGGESGLRKVGLCGTHPLTQRYGARTSHTQSVAIIDLYQRIGHES